MFCALLAARALKGGSLANGHVFRVGSAFMANQTSDYNIIIYNLEQYLAQTAEVDYIILSTQFFNANKIISACVPPLNLQILKNRIAPTQYEMEAQFEVVH